MTIFAKDFKACPPKSRNPFFFLSADFRFQFMMKKEKKKMFFFVEVDGWVWQSVNDELLELFESKTIEARRRIQ